MFYIILFIPKFSYIKLRLLSFLNHSSGDSYQSDKASEAIINGGFFGKGIGEGTLNSKIPEAHTDYIVSVISEEFGIVIIVMIMLIYLILSYKILKKIDDEKDTKIKLILLGKLINLCSLPFEKLFGPTILSKKLSESLRGKNSPKGTSIFLSK